MRTERLTERLCLRPFTWDDLPFLVALHADPVVARYLGTGRPRSAEESRAWLEKMLGWMAEDGLGHLALVTRADGQVVGRCGLSWFEVEEEVAEPRAFWGRGAAPDGVRTTPVLEIGYALHPAAWGRGLATEAARAMRDEAFESRGASCVLSVIDAENTGSVRVAHRNGLVDRCAVHVFGRVLRLFELGRPAWARLREARGETEG